MAISERERERESNGRASLGDTDTNINSINSNNPNSQNQSNQTSSQTSNQTKNTHFGKNQRDYDKEPIVVKDCIMKSIYRKIAVFILKFGARPEYFLEIIKYYDRDENISVHFYNYKIQKKFKETIIDEININEISCIFKTMNYTFPIIRYESQVSSNKFLIILCLFILFYIFIIKGFLMILWIILAAIGLFILNQFIIHNNSNLFYDVLFIKEKKGKFINFLVSSESEYKELKQYFQIKTGKNLDKVEKKITALFEFKKQDFE